MAVHVYIFIAFISGLSLLSTVNAEEFDPVVVEGDFLYAQLNPQTGRVLAGKSVRYHVRREDFRGIAAWKVSMKSPELDTDIFIRQSDGVTLYVKRTNHAVHHTVEILYGSSPDQESVYRRYSADEEYTRKIRDVGLIDLGALPQLLLGMTVEGALSDLHFNSIDFASGKVYAMAALHVGYKRVRIGNRVVRCALYDIRVDSWVSIFTGRVRLMIPLKPSVANFISYEGPSFTNDKNRMSLRLIGRNLSLAAN